MDNQPQPERIPGEARSRRTRKKPRPRRRPDQKLLLILMAILFLLAICGVAFYVIKFAPTSEHIEPSKYFEISGDEAAVMVDGELYTGADGSAPGMITGGESYIRLDVVKDYMDDGYVYDDMECILRYATDQDVITASLNSPSYSIGRETVELEAPIVIEESDVYLSCGFLTQFTPVVCESYEDPGRIVVTSDDHDPDYACITRDTAVRRLGGPKSPIIRDAKKDDTVEILERYGKWTKVATYDGYSGCVRSDRLDTKVAVDRVTSGLEPREYQHILMDRQVCLLWHQVTNTTANSSIGSVLSKVAGVNVISPTWFAISNEEGGLSDIASLDYVNTCHARGIQVWGLISDFEHDIDVGPVLNVTSARDNLVNNVIAKAIAYNLDGINIDFEKVPATAADGYIQFIRELSIKCENNDLILSIDNYPPREYNRYYNRSEQAKYADYVIVMAYDEHYSTSEEAGSNSSLPFVEDALEGTLSDVPNEQTILGLPFYVREFTTQDGQVSQRAFGMKDVDSYLTTNGIEAKWLEDLSQNYAEYEDAEGLHQLWIEDSRSLAMKMALIKDKKLGGGAFWKEGFENDNIWDVVIGYINQ